MFSHFHDEQSCLAHLLDKLSNSDIYGRVWPYRIIAAASGNLESLTMQYGNDRAVSNGIESRTKGAGYTHVVSAY